MQGRDPLEAAGTEFLVGAGLGAEPAVADNHVGKVEALAEGLELGGEEAGVGGVAREDVDGDGAAPALPVAGEAALGEGATGAFEPGPCTPANVPMS